MTTAAVVAINQYHKFEQEANQVMQVLIRCLAFITATCSEFLLSASHIPGVENTAADALSRDTNWMFSTLTCS